MPRFMTSAATPPDAVVRQAIAWWARLQSGIVDAGEREACQAWLAQDPAHRKAWERLETIGRDARRVPAALAHTALDGPATPDRRVALRNLLTLAGVGVAGWAGYRHAPWQRLAADVSTGIGERRAVAVADGLHVTLNSDSALRLASGARGIHLLRGEILVSAQARPGAPRCAWTPAMVCCWRTTRVSTCAARRVAHSWVSTRAVSPCCAMARRRRLPKRANA